MAEGVASSERKLANTERKDRSIRLWGEAGQLALESTHVCLLNAKAVGTEVLKNLVLPGIGRFTIVDAAHVTEQDLGNNFFVDSASLGKPRCQVVTSLLLELNEEVKGQWVEEDPEALLSARPEFFHNFSCVVACDLREPALLNLGAELWEKNIPLFIARTCGMIGSWRSVVPEVTIVESKPEFSNENYRVVDPWPELQAFASAYQLASITDKKEHSRVPAFVLLMHALDTWRASHPALPRTSADKSAFKEILASLALFPMEENVEEALEMVNKVVFAFSSPDSAIPSTLKRLFDDPACENISPESTPFWIMLRGLREFVSKEGGGRHLPVTGVLPDMHCDTQTYIALQKVYHDQATADVAAVAVHVANLQARVGQTEAIPLSQLKTFCRNACNLRVVRTRSVDDEYSRPNTSEWSAMLEMPEFSSHHLYVLLRVAERFRTQLGRAPGVGTESVEADVGKLTEMAGQLASDLGIPTSSIRDEHVQEICYYSAVELQSVAAILGGVGAQEVVKIVMRQFEPLNNTFIFNGVTGVNTSCAF